MNQTPTILVAVFVRLFAIGLLIYLVRGLGLEYVSAVSFESYEVSIGLGVVLAFIAALVVFLWKFPLFVASKLLGSISAETLDTETITEHSLYNLGLVLLGIFLLYLAVSDTVYWSYHVGVQRELTQFTSELDIRQKAAIATTAAEFIMAILLIAGSRTIARLLLKLRRAGT